MKSLDEALLQLLAHAAGAARLPSESIQLTNALNRVLAQEVVSPICVPAYDNSQMDGYAGVAVEMNNALEPLVVSQRIPAGHPGKPLKPGTVVRIFTGAPIPQGANAVIMQEQVRQVDDDHVQCLEPVTPGQNIRLKAADLSSGQVILSQGKKLSAADIALAASVGVTQITVYQRLKVAVFSSGDELRQPGEPLEFGQIYDSNRPMVLNLVKAMGLDASDMGCLPDRLDTTRQALGQAASTHDVILTCGGVSVGEEDHIKAAISAEGQLDLWKIALKPGKPFAFGQVGKATFLGMPGNPVAAWVTFAMLIRPYLMLRAAGGMRHQHDRSGAAHGSASLDALIPSGYRVVAAFDWSFPDARQEFLRGWIDHQGRAQIHDRQNSAVLSSVTASTGLIEIPALTPVRQGNVVRYIPYAELQ